MSWTWLRHAMLDAVAAGAVSDNGGTWQFRRRPSTRAQMSRACNWLWEADALAVVNEGRVEITESGQRLLDTWRARHPEVAE